MTDTINKIIKEFREKFWKTADIYGNETTEAMESFLTLSLEKVIQEAREEERKKIFKRIRETLGDSAYFEINSEVKSAENRILNYIINLEADFLKQQDTLSLKVKERK